MIRSLRWYPFPDLGCFVAEDQKAVLVAPMLTDGTRSTYEGEIVALDQDSREADPALDVKTSRRLEVGQIADAFRSVLRSWLTEAQLVEIDRRNKAEANDGICHTHDFCDSNMAMLEGFEKAMGRPLFVDGTIPSESESLFNEAWDLAKADGFATWAPSAEDLERLEQIAADADLGIAHATAGNWLRLFVDRVKSVPVPLPYDESSDADRAK